MNIIPKQLAAIAGVGALASVGLFAAIAPTQKTTSQHDRFISEIETVLAMTPQQKDEAQTSMHEARQSAMPIRQELKNTNTALQNAVRSNDRAQIQRLSTTEGQEIGQLLAIRSSAVAKVYNTLRPDQKSRADALQGLLQQGMQQHMEHSHSQRGS